MLYADFNDILISVCYSALFGIVMGILFIVLRVLVYAIDGFIRLPKTIYQASGSLVTIKSVIANSKCFKYSENKARVFFFDFIYIILNGILFSLLLYLTTDGVFRLYVLIISFALARLFIKYLGNHTALFLNQAILLLYSMMAMALSIMLYPVRKVIQLTIGSIIKKRKNEKERTLCKLTKKIKEKRIT